METDFGTDIATPVFEMIDLDTFGEEYQEKSLVLQGCVALAKIENQAQFQQVATAGLDAAANIKAIEACLNPLKEKRYAAWKRVCEVMKAKTDPFLAVKEKSGQLIGVYQYEIKQQRLREENEERARQAAEDEKSRAVQAEQLATEGRIEDGVALLETPVVNVAPVMATTQVPKAQGITDSGDGVFSAEVTDLMALVKAVASGAVPIMALEANQKWLNGQAKSMKQFLAYPGVKVNRTFKSGFRPK